MYHSGAVPIKHDVQRRRKARPRIPVIRRIDTQGPRINIWLDHQVAQRHDFQRPRGDRLPLTLPAIVLRESKERERIVRDANQPSRDSPRVARRRQRLANLENPAADGKVPRRRSASCATPWAVAQSRFKREQAQPTVSAGQKSTNRPPRKFGDVVPAQTVPELNPGETGHGTFVPVVYGYARVSRGDSQSLDRQIFECTQVGATRVFTDQLSGGRATESRPGFADAVSHLRAHDILVVVELSRLSRSLTDLMGTVDQLVERGVVIRVLNLGDFDNRSPTSRLLWSILGAVAEMERSMIRERTLSGLEQARRSGVQLGRRPSLDALGVRTARSMRASGASVVQVGQALGVSERTVRRAIADD